MIKYYVDIKVPGYIFYLTSIESTYESIVGVRLKSGEAITSAFLPRINICNVLK